MHEMAKNGFNKLLLDIYANFKLLRFARKSSARTVRKDF